MKILLSKILRKNLILSVGLFVFGAIFSGGAILITSKTSTKTDPNCVQYYPLLRNDLDCKSADEDYSRIEDIQALLNFYIEKKKSTGQINRISVFFRDLSSRRFASVNGDQVYAPASLLKLPLAIAYYKLSEIEPQILTQEMQYQPDEKDQNDLQEWKPSVRLEPGKTYTVKELIKHMLLYSDNEAAQQLTRSIDEQFFKKVNSDLGITIPKSSGPEQSFLTAKTYASLLRALFLSSYLNIDNSQELLDLMTNTAFTDGIKAGIPEEVRVAHKFGEREMIEAQTQTETTAQLHDCGIIYKPDHPYILCIMTEGKSHEGLSTTISDISRMIFDHE